MFSAWPICISSHLASFKRAQASSADPKVEADTERAASARRYSFAEESRSEYAVSEDSRSDLESTACGRWGGGGGRGRLNEDGIGLAVLA